MKRLLFWCAVLPPALVLIAFAVVNRGRVKLSFAPLPFELDLPLFALAFGALFFGLLLGLLLRLVALWRWRAIALQRARRLRVLEREVETLKGSLDRSRLNAGPQARTPSHDLVNHAPRDAA